MGSRAMGRVRGVPGGWEGTLRLVDTLKDLTVGEWNEGTKDFFSFLSLVWTGFAVMHLSLLQ